MLACENNRQEAQPAHYDQSHNNGQRQVMESEELFHNEAS